MKIKKIICFLRGHVLVTHYSSADTDVNGGAIGVVVANCGRCGIEFDKELNRL